MFYQPNWCKIKQRLLAVWENELIDRCCIAVTARKDPSKPMGLQEPILSQEDVAKRYFDPEWLNADREIAFANTYYAGDSFPVMTSNFGTGGHAKYFKGAQFQITPETIWVFPSMTGDTLDPAALQFDLSSAQFQKELEVLRQLCKLADGRYMVGFPDNCGSIDALASLRGSENLLCDMLDDPAAVHASLDRILDAYRQTTALIFDVLKENNEGGSVHYWMNSYSSKRHVQLQVDFSAMISPALYHEFAVEELLKSTQNLDQAIYHLDGQEQIRHLDDILSVPKIRRIQWTPVAGQPRTSAHIQTLQRIQKAGRGLVLFPQRDEVEFLLTNLSSKGLQLILGQVDSIEEADYWVGLAQKLTHE